MSQRFILREASSDVVGARVLGEFTSPIAVQLDFVLAAGAALATLEEFITPASLPAMTTWKAGDYVLALEVAAAMQISFTVEARRADKDGLDVAQIGSQPALQTGTGTKTFTVTGVELAPLKTDRLKLKLLARNDDGANPQTFSVKASLSTLQTPIEKLQGRAGSAANQKRTRFLRLPRPGEPKPDPDGFVPV